MKLLSIARFLAHMYLRTTCCSLVYNFDVSFSAPISPQSDTITVDFAKMLPELDLNVHASVTNFEIFDVWTKETHGPAATYSALVGGHDTVFLIVTPSAL